MWGVNLDQYWGSMGVIWGLYRGNTNVYFSNVCVAFFSCFIGIVIFGAKFSIASSGIWLFGGSDSDGSDDGSGSSGIWLFSDNDDGSGSGGSRGSCGVCVLL